MSSARRQRSDGLRTRGSILRTAAALATTEGLDRLSIGGLADHIGMSKSGLFSHFRSKEALQLATIDVAWEIFDSEVVRPALSHPEGLPRLLALVDGFLDHLQRRVFPGGCFFASSLAELHMRPSSVTDRLDEFYTFWGAHLRADIAAATTAGDIVTGAEVEQIEYEIGSHLLHAHMAYLPVGDVAVLDRTRLAIRRLLGIADAGDAGEV